MRMYLFPLLVLLACGGSTSHPAVDEVPIDRNAKRPTDLPPDEVGSNSGGQVTTASLPDSGPPPGVGPQPLGGTASADAGAATTAFVQRTGGLTQKECTDVVMKFATLMTKETKVATPTTAEIPQHNIYGQMLTECGQGATKKQHKCAMATRTSATWKKCME